MGETRRYAYIRFYFRVLNIFLPLLFATKDSEFLLLIHFSFELMRISSRQLPVIQYDDHYALIGYYGKDLIYNPQITCLSQKSPLQNSAGHSTCRKPFNGWFYFKWCQALFTQFRIEIDKYWDEFEMKYFLLVKSSVHSARSRGPNINFVCT